MLQDQLDRIPAGFSIHDTVLRGMADVSDETIVVALFAGVAGMLAIETRAGTAPGAAAKRYEHRNPAREGEDHEEQAVAGKPSTTNFASLCSRTSPAAASTG